MDISFVSSTKIHEQMAALIGAGPENNLSNCAGTGITILAFHSSKIRDFIAAEPRYIPPLLSH